MLALPAALALPSCSDPTGPAGESLEPEPFPDAIEVDLWIYASGLVLLRGERFQQGWVSEEPGAPDRSFTYPVRVGWDPIPSEYRTAWWSSDPEVARVDSLGVLHAVGAGQTTVWLQVESARDSATVRVGADGAAELRLASIEASASHTCARSPTGRAYCWGSDSSGQLGRGRVRWLTFTAAPNPVVGDERFTALTAGASHTCGLADGGRTLCWGDDRYGQVGNGTRDTLELVERGGVPRPMAVVGGLAFESLASTLFSTCGLDADGIAHCWGGNGAGELGIGSAGGMRTAPTPVAGSLAFRLLAGGYAHYCGVTSVGETFCWGSHNGGHVDERCCSASPVRLETDLVFEELTAGLHYSCGRTAEGRVHCWGDNASGQLGDGTSEDRPTPVPVTGGRVFDGLVAGREHTCGLTPAGRAYCWGDHSSGQLGVGDGSFGPNLEPRNVAGGRTFATLAAGADHSCGITTEGVGYCWGWLHGGRLGNGRVQPIRAGIRLVSGFPLQIVAPM